MADEREWSGRIPPDELACDLSRDAFWRDETARLIGSHPDWPDAAFFLGRSEEIAKAVAYVRSDPALEDVADPHAVAALAVVEVLDPSSGIVAVQEVLARAAFATVERRTRAETLDFLIAVDRLADRDPYDSR